MIGVDWGTTGFRAFRLRDGTIIDRIDHGPGLLAVPPGGFPAALAAAVGRWLDAGEHQVLMAGMVGSRQGWVEAAYLPCPADPADLAAAAVRVPFEGAAVRLLPGLSARDADGVPEVMRGEEVQIAGVLPSIGPDALVCLPGSHSKWATVAGGRILGFVTHLTGEAFAALRHHTILGRAMAGNGAGDAADDKADDEADAAAFLRGVDRSGQGGGFLHHLFGTRSLGLFGQLDDRQAAAYLSGLLIGHEVRAMRPEGMVALVGATPLCARYAAAIRRCGAGAEIMSADAAAHGLARIGEAVTW